MIIDAYSHVCPAPFIDAIAKIRPSAESDALRSVRYLWDIDARIAYMDRHGIDMQVLVLVRPPMWLGVPREDVHELTKIANHSIAEVVDRYPDRFAGVGVTPIVDDVTMEHFETGHRDLGLRGTLMFSNIEGEPIDIGDNWALFSRCAELDLPIWIHPQLGHYYPWAKQDLLNRSLGWPFDTSLAMARLAYSGVFDVYPDIKFVTHHLGGMIPYYGARMDDFDAIISEYAEKGIAEQSSEGNGAGIGEKLRLFYNDAMVSGSVSALRCGLDFFGAARILYGTDFPMGEENGEKWPLDVLKSINSIDISAEDRMSILSGNAIRLLGL